MYLNQLNIEERKGFLELAYYAMGVDGIYQTEEKILFDSYKHECYLLDYEISQQNDIDNVILNFEYSSNTVKKIIILELFGILLADEIMHDKEKEFIKKLTFSFKISEEDSLKIYKWVLAMNHITKLGYTIIQKQ